MCRRRGELQKKRGECDRNFRIPTVVLHGIIVASQSLYLHISWRHFFESLIHDSNDERNAKQRCLTREQKVCNQKLLLVSSCYLSFMPSVLKSASLYDLPTGIFIDCMLISVGKISSI